MAKVESFEEQTLERQRLALDSATGKYTRERTRRR